MAARTDSMLMRPLLSAALVLIVAFAPAFAQGVYRHVDERGRVTFSDVPPDKSAQRLKQAAPNVGSPEAVKQLEIAKRERQQLEAEERLAAQRRASAAQPASPPPPPLIIPGRRAGYDSTQPPAQAAGDSSRRY